MEKGETSANALSVLVTTGGGLSVSQGLADRDEWTRGLVLRAIQEAGLGPVLQDLTRFSEEYLRVHGWGRPAAKLVEQVLMLAPDEGEVVSVFAEDGGTFTPRQTMSLLLCRDHRDLVWAHAPLPVVLAALVQQAAEEVFSEQQIGSALPVFLAPPEPLEPVESAGEDGEAPSNDAFFDEENAGDDDNEASLVPALVACLRTLANEVFEGDHPTRTDRGGIGQLLDERLSLEGQSMLARALLRFDPDGVALSTSLDTDVAAALSRENVETWIAELLEEVDGPLPEIPASLETEIPPSETLDELPNL